MYSLNAPVPGAISALAWDLRSSLTEFEYLRDDLTLVIKRLEARSAGEFAAVERAIREELSGTAPFEAAVGGIGVFRDPPAGPAPVVYLEVESPEMESLHRRLVDRFGALGAVEGDTYTPHITLARGASDPAVVDWILETEIGLHRWTVNRLLFWDARRELPAGDVSLPT